MRKLLWAALPLALIPVGTASAKLQFPTGPNTANPEFLTVTTNAADRQFNGLRRDIQALAGKPIVCTTHNRATLYKAAAQDKQIAYDEYQLAFLGHRYSGLANAPDKYIRRSSFNLRRASRWNRMAAHALVALRRCAN